MKFKDNPVSRCIDLHNIINIIHMHNSQIYEKSEKRIDYGLNLSYIVFASDYVNYSFMLFLYSSRRVFFRG